MDGGREGGREGGKKRERERSPISSIPDVYNPTSLIQANLRERQAEKVFPAISGLELESHEFHEHDMVLVFVCPCTHTYTHTLPSKPCILVGVSLFLRLYLCVWKLRCVSELEDFCRTDILF
jgi:hypothetical protein